MKEWLQKLKESKKHIVVEGIKDKRALINIGILAQRIHTLKKPLFAASEDIAQQTKDIIILTDIDREGKKLYVNLRGNFARLGVRTDTYFREFLFNNSELSHIEGIDTYFKNMVE